MSFFSNVLYSLLISFGVIIGACSFAGVGALVNNQPPLKTMMDLANSVKIWAIATALGGTFSSFEAIEEGIFNGDIRTIVKQVIYILAAIIGANVGYRVIKLIQKCGQIWMR